MQREFNISLSQDFYSDVVYLSQYDSDYNIIFNVKQKYASADVDDLTAYFQGTRSDGLGFQYSTTGDGSTLTFSIDTQLTAVAGTHTGEIVIYDGNGLYFGSANVQIIVETAAHSESTVDADVVQQQTLLQQIQTAVSSVVDMTVSASTLSPGEDATVTKTIENDIVNLAFGLPKGETGETGPQGATGPEGNGIASIVKTGTSGLVDTYTITYDDGTTSTFTITNGADATIDATLTQSGQAADAKATGDAISTLNSDISDINADTTNKSSNADLQSGTYNIVTPSMHVGTWREGAQEFAPSTNRVVFDASQPYTGTERVYAFDSTVCIFAVFFDSNDAQLGYVGWVTQSWGEFKTAGGYFDIDEIAKGAGITNASKYLCVLKFYDDRTINTASEMANKVIIVNGYEGEGFELPLVIINPYLEEPFIKIYPNSGQVQINGNMYVYTKEGYYCIPIHNTYSVALTHGQTLVLDLADIPINYENVTIDKSSALKVVNYSNYSKMCIPIANCRYYDGKMHLFVSGTFTQFIVSELNKESLKLETFKEAYYPYTMHNAGSEWSSRINLLHISDTHMADSNAYNNLIESIDVGNSLYADGVISAVVNTGDNTNGANYPLSTFLAQYTKNTAALATSTAPYLMQLGNHDANNYVDNPIANVPTDTDLFPPFQNIFAQSGVVAGDATNKKRYYYYDVTQGGHTVRIIMLDMLDHPDYTGSNTNYVCQSNVVYSQDQIDWLANTALDVPADYGVIICNHFPFAPLRSSGYSEEYPALNDGYFVQSATGNRSGGWKMIPEIVQAWQSRTTLSKTYTDTKGSQNIVADYDFSNVPASAFFVCYLCGHTHSKNVFKVEEENGVSFDQLMMCEDSSGQNGTALNRCYKRFGKISDNAFSCISIDMEEKKIYRTSYGVYAKCNDVDAKQTQVFDIL